MPFENFLKDFQSYPSIFPCIQFLHNNIWPFNIYFFLLGVSEPLYWNIQPGSPFPPHFEDGARDKDLVLERDSKEETWEIEAGKRKNW